MHSGTWRKVFRLGLDDGDGKISGETKEIVGPLLRAAVDFAARNHDPAVGKSSLLGEGMRIAIPPGIEELGENVFSASIGFIRHFVGSVPG